MNFAELTKLIAQKSDIQSDFLKATSVIQRKLFSLSKKDLIGILKQIGTIPENIEHDSTEEKLYSKVTDIILARSFQELGLKSSVIKERANCADVAVKSVYHGYSLVGDAKSFRLSRTARNQKDFKVKSMSDWKGENDYSVLVSPFFKYPKKDSQIYGQALDSNVCLLSWEHISFLLENNIKETIDLNLSFLWKISSIIAKDISISQKNNNFYHILNSIVCDILKCDEDKLKKYFFEQKDIILKRSKTEISYWQNKIKEIKSYSKKKAIDELLSAIKVESKIASIEKYVKELKVH